MRGGKRGKNGGEDLDLRRRCTSSFSKYYDGNEVAANAGMRRS